MFRFFHRSPAALLAPLLVFCLASVQAQGSAVNVPVQAVVSYANLLTPDLVTELWARYSEPDDFAFALIERHVADATICPATAEPIKLALTNGALPHEAFVFYLADMINRTACAPTTLEVALAQLANAGVQVPLANAGGYITSETLAAALTESELASGMQPGSDGSYEAAITPTTGQ